MNLKPFEGPDSTPSRRRFWDAARDAVMLAQKVGGRFVSVDEHPGKGSVINVADRKRPLPIFTCPATLTIAFLSTPANCANCIAGPGPTAVQWSDLSFNDAQVCNLCCGASDCGISGDDSVAEYQGGDFMGCGTYAGIGTGNFWTGVSICSGTPDGFPIGNLFWHLGRASGLWYCALFARDAGLNGDCFFYGGGVASLGDTITNALSCSTSFRDYSPGDNFWIDFLGSTPITGRAFGGSVTITSP